MGSLVTPIASPEQVGCACAAHGRANAASAGCARAAAPFNAWWHNGKIGKDAAGHVAIYDNNAGTTEKGQAGHLWSATNRKDTVGFGPARVDFYDNKNGYGIVTWYRYWTAP